MALVPLGTWIMTQYMVGHHPTIRTEATRELLFFALSAASMALVVLNEAADGVWSRFGILAALILTIASAIAYGEFLTGEALRAAVTLRPAYHWAIDLAIAAFFLSAIVEVFTRWRSHR
jgi:hypothetical protein